mmetsp:Transcript_16531/g.22652  ORF Transcript_16531/g.22652 Transcript_16531/m.22652 type:complete len:503 (-) Transcript_16531:367-1875(-)|eukprot:CAMPEP_0185740840 /NCGR_PEP_ID=MMETSP1171-20130828/38638_1 /TAXON_ID=374046 /ORGANISM="Helicotheca tamensis, Strain CCMP826" /LENGTH=502 /DNA_ID=CAMNT_0028412769 /DNA_START=93 /DNA_END=1601 /DNA_ORIENTATION=-
MSGDNKYDWDYLVIGGGSGGIASAKRAASHGAKVAVIEGARLGGTCVNVGCVPKKVMWSAATIADILKHDMHHYGFPSGPESASKFDWAHLKKARDAYVLRLNGIYANGFTNAGVEHIEGFATFKDAHTVEVSKKTAGGEEVWEVTAQKILIATGGRPTIPPGEGIAEHCIDSDGFFEMEELPKNIVVVGAGYIAVELAGVLNSLGSEVHLAVRKGKALRNFDPTISDGLDAEMIKAGIHIHRHTNGVKKIEIQNGKKTVTMHSGDVIYGVDVVLMAAGRAPNVANLNLEKAGVDLKGKYIKVDEYSNTTASNILALGDVCGVVELTPMAIAAGRRLSDRLFGGEQHANAKVSYENVPTVVFSHPTIGTCGLTEPAAIEKYGEDNIKIYNSKFANLYYGIFTVEPADKPKTIMKLICAGEDEKVVGMHVLGMGADEMMQGFGVAMKMGCTKADLDSCVAIHPTAAEEFVTMGVWGTSSQATGAKISPLNGAAAGEPTLKSKI